MSIRIKNMKARLVCCTAFSVFFLFPALTAKAEEPSINFTADLKSQSTFENDMDLGTAGEGGSDNEILEAKIKVDGKITEQLSYLLEARGVKNYGEGGSFDEETGEATGREDYLELRQYWANYDKMFGSDALSLRVGRQRIREDYGLWWNRDQDAARLFYGTTLANGFVGIGQNLAEYRSSDDTYNEDDEELLRLFGEGSLQWKLDQYVEGRFMYQDDHSGLEDTGAVVDGDDYDSADADLFWLGLRLKGEMPGLKVPAESKKSASYRFDIMGVAGEEDTLSTTSGPGTDRTVTGSADQDVMGWAVDMGVEVPLPVATTPTLYAGYAYGSGDDDATDDEDHAFRQTGLDGNSSRLADYSSTINNYGSVLRPDLSNIHIATLGVTVPVTETLDLAGIYRYYRLADSEGELTSSGISAPLNGEDSNLGQGLDVVLNMNVADQLGLQSKDCPLKRLNFKTTLGGFWAGDAYGDASDEEAYRAQVDLSLRF